MMQRPVWIKSSSMLSQALLDFGCALAAMESTNRLGTNQYLLCCRTLGHSLCLDLALTKKPNRVSGTMKHLHPHIYTTCSGLGQ